MKLKKNITTKKEFSYSKGKVNLGFNLNVDTKSDLINFRDCLDQAKKDIDNILEKMK